MSRIQVYSISDLLTDDAWAKIFSAHFKQKIEASSVDLKPLKGSNDFYNSEIVKGSISITIGGEVKTMHVVIKSPLQFKISKIISKATRPFMIENFFYAKCLPELSDLVAKSYYSYSSYQDDIFDESLETKSAFFWCWLCCVGKSEKAILIMEDLTKVIEPVPFAMVDKSKIPSVQNIKFIFSALARFHGSWFKFLRQGNGDMPYTPDDLKKPFFRDMTPMFKFVLNMQKELWKAIIILMKNRHEKQELIERFKKYTKVTYPQKLLQYATDIANADDSKLLTLCHMDFWGNNIMVMKDEEGDIKRVKFLDFSLCKIAFPFFDLIYFLYIHTDYEFRQRHLDAILSSYFNDLTPYIGSFQMTFNDFKADFEKYLDAAVIGIGVMTAVLSPCPVDKLNLSTFRKLGRKWHEEIASPDKDDDHQMIKEIRRRILGFVHELEDRNML